MRQRLLLRIAVVAVGAAGVAGGCHPLGISDSSETDTVVTIRAHGVDYASNRTYDMPDTVADLCNGTVKPLPDAGGGGEGGGTPVSEFINCENLTHSFDTVILDEIRRELEGLGYVRIDKNSGEKPDVLMLVGAIAANNWVAYSAYPWYGYYPGYGGWYGWGVYYPYYPVTTVVNYPTGTILMDLVSVKDADNANRRLPSIWVGAIDGLLAAGDVNATTRITGAIDQAFAQSQYLRAGGQ